METGISSARSGPPTPSPRLPADSGQPRECRTSPIDFGAAEGQRDGQSVGVHAVQQPPQAIAGADHLTVGEPRRTSPPARTARGGSRSCGSAPACGCPRRPVNTRGANAGMFQCVSIAAAVESPPASATSRRHIGCSSGMYRSSAASACVAVGRRPVYPDGDTTIGNPDHVVAYRARHRGPGCSSRNACRLID